ncbi:MAG TPA: RNA-binding protein [Stellaceae bacterium]|nr:RNA-binding protein [Stellaceae bacterium]
MWVRNNKGNVFVGNLPPNFGDERLAETFDPYGIVLSAAVARDPATGAKLRYGFVDIATERAMAKAIGALDGSEIDGCKLNVKPRDKAKKKPGAAPPRRPPLHATAAKRLARDFGASRDFAPAREPTDRPPPQRVPLSLERAGERAAGPQPEKLSQSQRAMESMPEIEPPPRRDFEVVRRPVRRSANPSFQVERRSLPRRV